MASVSRLITPIPGMISRRHSRVRRAVFALDEARTAASEPPRTITIAWLSKAEIVVSVRSWKPNQIT